MSNHVHSFVKTARSGLNKRVEIKYFIVVYLSGSTKDVDIY